MGRPDWKGLRKKKNGPRRNLTEPERLSAQLRLPLPAAPGVAKAPPTNAAAATCCFPDPCSLDLGAFWTPLSLPLQQCIPRGRFQSFLSPPEKGRPSTLSPAAEFTISRDGCGFPPSHWPLTPPPPRPPHLLRRRTRGAPPLGPPPFPWQRSTQCEP
jgi:hypothetical protein